MNLHMGSTDHCSGPFRPIERTVSCSMIVVRLMSSRSGLLNKKLCSFGIVLVQLIDR